MPEKTATIRAKKETHKKYIDWARSTGRNVADMVNIALLYALRHQSDVEHEVALTLEPKR
jgi:hypothetical protein